MYMKEYVVITRCIKEGINITTHDLRCNTYAPVEVHMSKLVCEPLKFIRVKSNIIADHIV